jgi:hypothetical protein
VVGDVHFAYSCIYDGTAPEVAEQARVPHEDFASDARGAEQRGIRGDCSHELPAVGMDEEATQVE